VCTGSAFVDVSTRCSVALETAIASARKPGHPVGALRISAAVVKRVTAALVNIGANFAVAGVASVASAIEARNCIYAFRIAVAGGRCRRTLINVGTACQPVTSVTTFALTLQTSADILASAVYVAGRGQIASCVKAYRLSSNANEGCIFTAFYKFDFGRNYKRLNAENDIRQILCS